MEQEETAKLDFGSIDFTPDWAKKGAGVTVGKVTPLREDRPAQGPEKSFPTERKSFGGERRPTGEAKKFSRGDRSSNRPRLEDRPRPLNAEVKVLPETKSLGTIIRKLQGDSHAYKLKDIAFFFLDNPSSVLLKISLRPPADVATSDTRFFQCKACGFVSTNEADVIDHILTVHLADYYESKEIDVEPPTGNFNCVAKCGLTGVLLGPPNIHEFNGIIREIIRTKFPEMTEDQYRSHIEMVRDAEAIEQWRASAVKRTVFFPKGMASVEGAKSLTREQAEGEFKRTILASLLDAPKNVLVTADVAMRSPVKPIVWVVRDAIEAERRAPYGMCYALRGAFHHRKLHFFRANDARGPEFVSGVEYKEFDVTHAIPELATIARFVSENPCCDKGELPDLPDAAKHLEWLVSTGHVVAFTNGVYSAVEKYPKYGPQWKKRAAKPAATAAATAPIVAETEVKPAAETEVEPAAVEKKIEEKVEETKDETAPVVAE